MSYYEKAFAKLIEAGVPKWYIRLYLLTDLIYSSRVYIYRNVYDIEAEDGWYATNGIAIIGGAYRTEADKNRKCYGELKSMGFPTWDEYKTLFDGDEYDQPHEFLDAYDRHQEDWIQERARERRISYQERSNADGSPSGL